MTTIRFSEVMGRLNAATRAAGGESAFARAHGLNRQDVHEALKGNRHPAPAMLAAVGVRKVVTTTYELIQPAAAAPAVPEPGTCACPATAERVCLNPACPRQPAQHRQVPQEAA